MTLTHDDHKAIAALVVEMLAPMLGGNQIQQIPPRGPGRRTRYEMNRDASEEEYRAKLARKGISHA